MVKRFFLRYESDKTVCGSNWHTYGDASTLKTAKSYISRVKKRYPEENPRNFRIYDSWGDVSEDTGFVPCVYKEE